MARKAPPCPPSAPAEILESFAALYRACGLPAPAVRMERSEPEYRRAADVLSGDRARRRAWLGNAAMAISSVAFLCGIVGCGLVAIDFAFPPGVRDPGGAWRAAAWMAALAAVSASGASGACFLERLEEAPRLRSQELLGQHGIPSRRPTPRALGAMLASALSAPGRVPEDAPGRGSASFLDRCFRLGRSAVLPPSSHPAMHAMAGKWLPDDGVPGLMRLAASAASLVEEAVLMDGFVLALAPGPARPGPGRVAACLPGSLLGDVPRGRGFPQDGEASSRADALAALARHAASHAPWQAEAQIRLLGPDAAAAALGLLPAASDSSGRLYRFLPGLCMVRVEDDVIGPDGIPLVHWITVPPHVITPWEGVAWSFGLAGADYSPTAES